MKLWGTGTARSLRPIWVAEELGLQYELDPIGPRTGETQTPEYTAMNRKQKIPFLVDGDIQLSESVAICRYLIETYPCANLDKPQSAFERAKEDEWCCYIYGEIDETSLYVMRRHRDLGAIYGTSKTIVDAAAAYAERHLTVVAHNLSDNEFLMGEQFRLPDVLLMTCLDWAVKYEVGVPESLLAYRERISQRTSYKNSIEINQRTNILE